MLKETIAKLTSQFAKTILDEIRSASFSEVTGVNGGARAIKTTKAPKTKASKRIRRTEADIGKLVATIAAAVKKAGADGIRAEDLRKKLGVEKKYLPKPIAVALSQKLFRKKGEKRTTTYYVGGVKTEKKAPKKPVKKAAAKTAAKPVKKASAKLASKRTKKAPKRAMKSIAGPGSVVLMDSVNQ
jgi:hypothetical protein